MRGLVAAMTLAASTLVVLPAHAQTATESHARIRAAAIAALTDAVAGGGGELRAVSVGLDPRLRVAACVQALESTLEGPSGRRSLARVRCPEPGGWMLRIPIQAQLWRAAVIAATPLVRGQTVAAGQLAVVDMDVFAAEPGTFSQIDQAVGLEATRNVAAGRALGTRSLAPARMVRRNTPVRIQTVAGPIQVQSPGIALADGRLGETISVRNPGSGRVLSARVVAAGVVEVAR